MHELTDLSGTCPHASPPHLLQDPLCITERCQFHPVLEFAFLSLKIYAFASASPLIREKGPRRQSRAEQRQNFLREDVWHRCQRGTGSGGAERPKATAREGVQPAGVGLGWRTAIGRPGRS